MSEDIPIPRDRCNRFCSKHYMSQCGGSFHHRGKHQCPDCATPDNPRGEYV